MNDISCEEEDAILIVGKLREKLQRDELLLKE